MTGPMEDAIRAVLRDLSQEAVPLNLTQQAIRGAARRRIALTAAGVAAVTAIGLAAAPLALAAASREPTVTTTPASPTTHPSPVRQFDPGVRSIAVGWLPSPFRAGTTEVDVSAGSQRFEADRPGGRQGDGVYVTAMAAGAKFPTPRPSPSVPPTVTHAAPPVNGHRALCVDFAPIHCVSLRVEYATDAWFEAGYTSTYPNESPGEASARIANLRKMAASVRMDDTKRVRLPFRVRQLPKALHLTSTSVRWPGTPRSPWWATASFLDRDTPVTRTFPGSPSVDVVVAPASTQHQPSNTTVDGHPARRVHNTLGDTLDVFGVDGVDITVRARPASLAALLGPDGAVSMYHQLKLVPHPGSLAGWTDHPLG
ncbi:MAG: hypothetical protein JWO79_4558 [Actinomycetia bacterium]|nr:hypothetical protein [Actinomycetes bacterium]